MIIGQFDGGLSIRKSDKLIGPNEGIQVQNVDTSTHKLVPLKQSLYIPTQTIAKYAHYFEAFDVWEYSANERSYVEYKQKLYYTDETTRPQVNDGLTTRSLGLSEPEPYNFYNPDYTVDLLSPNALLPLSYKVENLVAVTEDGISGTNTFHMNLADFAMNPETLYFSSDSENIYTVSSIVADSGSYKVTLTTNLSSNIYKGTPVTIYTELVGSSGSRIDDTFYYSNTVTGADLYIFNLTSTYYADAKISGIMQLQTATLIPGENYNLQVNLGPIEADAAYIIYGASPHTGDRFTLSTLSISQVKELSFKAESGHRFYLVIEQSGASVDLNITLEALLYTYPALPEFALTLYNSTLDIESQPVFDFAGFDYLNGLGRFYWGNVNVPINKQHADLTRLYRRHQDTGKWTLIIEQSSDLNYLGTTYLPDIVYKDQILDSYNNNAPLENMNYLSVAYGRLFAAIENKLYYSQVGFFEYWPTFNYLEIEEDITGIAVVPSGLLVFSKYKTYLVRGQDTANFSVSILSNNVGCLSHYSIAYINSNAIWLSEEGIMYGSGGTITKASYEKLGDMKGFKNLAGNYNLPVAVTHQEKYYIAFDETRDFLNNCVLVGDITGGLKFYTSSEEASSLATTRGDLFSIRGTTLYETEAAATNKQLVFKSGQLFESGLTVAKTYNSFYISYIGDVTVTLFINDIEVASKILSSVDLDVQELHIPKSSQRGYTLSYSVSGTGEVYEAEFKSSRRTYGS